MKLEKKLLTLTLFLLLLGISEGYSKADLSIQDRPITQFDYFELSAGPVFSTILRSSISLATVGTPLSNSCSPCSQKLANTKFRCNSDGSENRQGDYMCTCSETFSTECTIAGNGLCETGETQNCETKDCGSTEQKSNCIEGCTDKICGWDYSFRCSTDGTLNPLGTNLCSCYNGENCRGTVCGNGVCEGNTGESYASEDSLNCPQDCGTSSCSNECLYREAGSSWTCNSDGTFQTNGEGSCSCLNNCEYLYTPNDFEERCPVCTENQFEVALCDETRSYAPSGDYHCTCPDNEDIYDNIQTDRCTVSGNGVCEEGENARCETIDCGTAEQKASCTRHCRLTLCASPDAEEGAVYKCNENSEFDLNGGNWCSCYLGESCRATNCGNGICESNTGESFAAETQESCPQDCTPEEEETNQSRCPGCVGRSDGSLFKCDANGNFQVDGTYQCRCYGDFVSDACSLGGDNICEESENPVCETIDCGTEEQKQNCVSPCMGYADPECVGGGFKYFCDEQSNFDGEGENFCSCYQGEKCRATNCGNGVCESDTGEEYARETEENCPQDCSDEVYDGLTCPQCSPSYLWDSYRCNEDREYDPNFGTRICECRNKATGACTVTGDGICDELEEPVCQTADCGTTEQKENCQLSCILAPTIDCGEDFSYICDDDGSYDDDESSLNMCSCYGGEMCRNTNCGNGICESSTGEGSAAETIDNCPYDCSPSQCSKHCIRRGPDSLWRCDSDGSYNPSSNQVCSCSSDGCTMDISQA